jgi:hypothetical protein
MIDGHVDWQDRREVRRVAAGFGDGVAHGSDIDEGGYAGRVVHQDTRRMENDLSLTRAADKPAPHGFNHAWQADCVFPGDVFQQDSMNKRQPVEVRAEGGREINRFNDPMGRRHLSKAHVSSGVDF